MRWKKLKKLYSANPVHPKLGSHAANPLTMLLEGTVYRVFFSERDAQNRSPVGFVDVDIVKREFVYVRDRPVFERGPEAASILMVLAFAIATKRAASAISFSGRGNARVDSTGVEILGACYWGRIGR